MLPLLRFQGSTVNMNIMQPIYSLIDEHIHGYKCLGIVLFVGKWIFNA